ncbi:MAG: MgtC/SapB family protein [Candidatus Aenigmarchaeota archaeon]|nr:MgtC/SapB family protein [Candidatus Aenigmarchaeota archaeon]
MEEIFLVILPRLIITFILSMAFGFHRQRAHKPVGFGTFTFVAIGSCGLAITALNLYPENPLSLLGAVVSGIGFLGAGALIKTTDKIYGFTSAASVWLFAIFGLIIGVGEYLTGILIYIMIWAVIAVDGKLKTHGVGSYQRKLTITTNRIIDEKEIEKELGSNFKKVFVKVDKKNGKISVSYLVEGTKDQVREIPERLAKDEWLEYFEIE